MFFGPTEAELAKAEERGWENMSGEDLEHMISLATGEIARLSRLIIRDGRGSADGFNGCVLPKIVVIFMTAALFGLLNCTIPANRCTPVVSCLPCLLFFTGVVLSCFKIRLLGCASTTFIGANLYEWS